MYFPLRFHSSQSAQNHTYGKDTACSLAQEGRPGYTGHTHIKGRHEQYIHADIRQGRYRQKNKGCLAVPQRGENAGGNVIEEHKGQSPDIDVQIQLGICKYLFRCVDELQKRVAAQKSNQHQAQAHSSAGDHGRINGCFHSAIILCAKQLGNDNRAADVAAKSKRDKDQRDLVAVAHRRQGVLADKLARHPAVRNVIKLLEDNAAKQGQAELPQHCAGFSYGQVLVHKISLQIFIFHPPHYNA